MRRQIAISPEQQKYACILADPPWSTNQTGKLGASRHYPVMKLKDICALRVEQLAADDSHLWLWICNNNFFEGLRVIEAWGFSYRSCLTWIKPRFGLGNYLRNQTEHLLLGVRGRAPIQFKAQGSWFYAPVQDHSHKPEEQYAIIERCSISPRVELFARRKRPGWHAWRNAADISWSAMSRSEVARPEVTVTFSGSAAVAMRRVVTVVVFVIAGLTFAFGFSNGWAVGRQLGAPAWAAPLVAPAVDLSVMAILTAMTYLRAHGVEQRLTGPRLLLIFSGVMTLALNTAHPLLSGEYGRAAFDAICPVLLIAWSEVAPKLLAALHHSVPNGPAVPGPSPVVPDGRTVVPPQLVAMARQLDYQHRQEHGRPISRDRLRAQLKVSNAVAGEVLRAARSQ